MGAIQPQQKNHKQRATIIAILVRDHHLISRWRTLLQRDGIRCFWFDKQNDLETFLDNTYADLLILHLSEMDTYNAMDTYLSRRIIGISDNPDDIDLMSAYGHWFSELTTKNVAGLLNM